MKVKIFIILIFALFPTLCFAQKQKGPKSRSDKSTKVKESSFLSEEERKEREESAQLEKEAKYYASIRYVIVYNWIFDELELPERRMDILIDARRFNRKNLVAVFELIKQRFPTPLRLEINVHTNLATIETPEEREMENFSGDEGRFTHTLNKYKRAFYMRFEDGKESFSYTTKLIPFYEEDEVFLKK